MIKYEEIKKFDEPKESHLERYIKNRNKRTGQEWVVTRRYMTQTMGAHPSYPNPTYNRAYIVAPHEKPVRIYYVSWRLCWIRAD